ncbi:MAG TPA: metal-sensitive transcriptional regulator [Gemmatimonadaceae bacterium]|jgi:DNA-binding FrmR family transcriptional regulator|nr:metal-sensitive transcriptional regulator [Gemmatimonadaceae bacterium]
MTAKEKQPAKRLPVTNGAACHCAAHEGEGARKAVAVDPDIKERNLNRLRRIEGQVRGIQRMIEEDRYCADILTQVSSVQEALRGVGRELMRNHLKHCATTAFRAGDAESESMYDELVDLMYKHTR